MVAKVYLHRQRISLLIEKMKARDKLDSSSPKLKIHIRKAFCLALLADGLNHLGENRLDSILIWHYLLKWVSLF